MSSACSRSSIARALSPGEGRGLDSRSAAGSSRPMAAASAPRTAWAVESRSASRCPSRECRRRSRRPMPDGDGWTVLLVEDEPQIRRLLRTALAAHGYRLIESSTGEDGLQQAATRLPDLVIVDLGLPDVDGVDVIRRLREWSATPIIVLSARGQERDKVEALEAGADDYVSKPFGVGELVARMRVALRHAARGPQAD